VTAPITHGLRPMRGRDLDAEHRPASTLELLFDLAFVIAFSVAGSEFAHLIAEGHYSAGLQAFGFAMFAVVWAWINFSWFASAYDTDDWIYRLTTMVQMVGVVILSLGLPAVFHSVDEGGRLDNRAIVVGYVIMRVPMVSQWLRAARQDPDRCRTCKIYAISISITQVGWILLLLVDAGASTMLMLGVPLVLAELAGPLYAERVVGGTPWHPHHIAERYGLLAIITLGEVLLGTVTSLGAVIDHDGWTIDAALIAVGGVGLTFGMWWIYFLLPAGHVLQHRREKSFVWGYGHIFVFAAIAAVGAGLHVAALAIEQEADISNTVVMWSIAIPVALYFFSLGGLFGNMISWRSHTTWLTVVKLAIAFGTVALAAAGVDLAVCILVIALAPAVTVVAEETAIGQLRSGELAEAIR
jgi:low temperature requirement protein LtrA